MNNGINQKFDVRPDELNVLHERADKYLKGETKTYTVEESHDMIRKQRNGISTTKGQSDE